MAGQMVKGTMLIDQVRMIRGNKNINWDKYLTPEDQHVIKNYILPSAWYPADTYKRCGRAVFQELAGGDAEIVRMRGQIRGRELFETTYKHVVAESNPMMALGNFVRLYGQLFNISPLDFKKLGDTHAQVTYFYDDKTEPGNLPFCYQLMGHMDTLILMTGGKNIKIELKDKLWEGADSTVFDIQWQ